MKDTPEPSDPVRERARELAGTFAGRGEATVVALLADAAEPGLSWRAAEALAGASAERRRTLLVNLSGAGSGLDGHLEVEDREGLEAVRDGRRKLSEAAVHPPGREFLYLPAGDPGPEPRPRPTEDPGVLRALERLAAKIREARGLLLLYLEAGALPPELAEELVDGAVPLVGADPHLPDGVPRLGRLAPPAGAEEESFLPGFPDGEAPEFGPEEAPEPDPEAASDAAGAAAEDPHDAGASGPADSRTGTGGREAGDRGRGSVPGEPSGTEAAPAGEEEPAGRPSGPEAPAESELAEDEPPGGFEAPAGSDAGEPPAPEAFEAPGEDAEDEGAWRRHRRSSGPPWGRIAVGTAAVVALAGGWWWFAQRTGPADAGAPAGGEQVAAADTGGADAAGPADTAAVEDGGEEAQEAAGSGRERTAAGAEGAPGSAVAEAATGLPRSVLVASYSSGSQAREAAARLRDEQGGTWIVAPTPVRGSLYWRLFAGALPDAAAGGELMARLVDRGVKDRARDWDVRPTPWAYRAAVHADREAAESRARELRDRGLPAYVLPAPGREGTVWQVYAGAFETRDAADRLGEMLSEAGVEAELVRRRGEGGGG